MRIHVFRHLSFEGLGMIQDWIYERGFAYTETRFWENSKELPDPESLDMLIVMGGPMNVDEEDKYPWLAEEKAYIRKAIEANVKVLGVCLGAQLISRAMGKQVVQSPYKEIGWFPVNKLFEKHDLFPALNGKDDVTVMHWHGDMFEIPDGADRIFESQGCPNQAFVLNSNRVVGLQFHLELEEKHILPFFENVEDELKEKAPYIQATDDILAGCRQNVGFARSLLFDLLDKMADLTK